MRSMTSATCARRDRQLRQIVALVEGGAHQRAAGLALEHLACFPNDTEALVRAGALSDDTRPTADLGSNQREHP